MNGLKTGQDGMMSVQAYRLSTEDTEKPPVKEDCKIAIEGPVTIEVEDFGTYTVFCTPDDKRAMAVGFLFSEGVIDTVGDIVLLNECIDDPNVIRIKLSETAPKGEGHGRNLLIVSSCGACGSESIEEKLAGLAVVGNTLKIKSDVLHTAGKALSERQVLFRQTGGTHAIGIFTETGEMISFAEDIGRHNALDKAIGKLLLIGRKTEGLGAVLSGRVSLEMVSKSARAGIEVISAVSAPTSLGLEAATRCNITLCAFVRADRATVFANPERILDGA
jgi:FdhD protein